MTNSNKMTPGEFKAWIKGFTEAISGMPTKKQWQMILDRIDSIETTQPIVIRDYGRPWWYTYQNTAAAQKMPPKITWSDNTSHSNFIYNASTGKGSYTDADIMCVAEQVGKNDYALTVDNE